MEVKNSMIQEVLKNLQRKSSKEIKTEMFKLIPEILDHTEFNEEAINFIFEGDEDLNGLCELTGHMNTNYKLKKSSKSILKMIYFILENTSKKGYFSQIFSQLDTSNLKKMRLGDHFYSHYKLNCKEAQQVPLEILKIVIDKRPYLDVSEIIKDSGILDIMKENLKKKLIMKKKAFRFFGSFIMNISKECNFSEPITWDDVIISLFR